MKKKLLFYIIPLFISIFSIHACYNGENMDHNMDNDTLYPCVNTRKLAVVLIDFPDIPPSIKAQFPTSGEAQGYFFSPSIKEYFKTISWGKFKFDGNVFGFFTMPDSLTKDKQNNEHIIKATESFDLKIPNFENDAYEAVAFIIFHNVYEQGGLSASGFANYTINGKKYEKQNVMYIGAWINDTTNTYTRPIKCELRYGDDESMIFEENHSIGWKYNQAIFVHEFIHLIRGDINIPHANTCTNNGKPDYTTPDTINQAKRFLNLSYGNKFDIMGGGSLSLSLNGGYRKLAGWCDESNTVTLKEKGTYRHTIYPLNSVNHYRLIEIRLTDKKKNKLFPEFPGYFLELREADKWDSPLDNQYLNENTKGILVYKTDGYTTMLLDMSPSVNFIDPASGKQFLDYRDMALKPQLTYENDDIKLTNVKQNSDGSYTLDILLK